MVVALRFRFGPTSLSTSLVELVVLSLLAEEDDDSRLGSFTVFRCTASDFAD
jgi:hypothetical protein